jgi:hypothetical protein
MPAGDTLVPATTMPSDDTAFAALDASPGRKPRLVNVACFGGGGLSPSSARHDTNIAAPAIIATIFHTVATFQTNCPVVSAPVFIVLSVTECS